MLPMEMIAKKMNFLSMILVSTSLTVFGTKTGAAVVMDLAAATAGVLLGASGRSPATENGASKTTADTTRAQYDSRVLQSTDPLGNCGLGADESWPRAMLPDTCTEREYSRSLRETTGKMQFEVRNQGHSWPLISSPTGHGRSHTEFCLMEAEGHLWLIFSI